MAIDRTRSSLELLLNISRQLATSLDLKTVLDKVLSLSIDNVDAERGTLIVLDDNQLPVNAAIVYNGEVHKYTIEQLQDVLEHGLAGWVLTHKKAVLITDTSQDDRWVQRPDDSIDRTGPKSAICVPMLTRERLVGVLTIVHPTPGYFNEENVALLQAIADTAALAINNAQLFESLQLVHQRYYQLFEDSIYPILITNWEGRILEANRQASISSGYSIDQLLRKSIYDMHVVSKQDMEAHSKLLEKDQIISYESQLLTKKGEKLPVEVFVRNISFQGTDSLQWILRDIKEKKDLDSLREDLAATIYHDLRSPLANIISSLDILNSMLPLETSMSLRSVFEITSRSADRMQRLISTLLDINRLETGQPITNQKTVDLLELMDESIEVVKPNIETKEQLLLRNYPKSLPAVFVDVDMIKRVLINLLENASKFTPIAGKIEVGGKFDDNWVTLWIRDSGPGIPRDFHDYIFEKFTRIKVDNAPKGVGLGLAFCRLAVNAHGGRIWVESARDKGSCFFFTLPVKHESS